MQQKVRGNFSRNYGENSTLSIEQKTPSTLVNLSAVTKRYDNKTIISSLDLTVNHGEFLTLLGPSGCGKTTVLRMIAGFESADEGRIEIDNQDVTLLPAEQRQVNTVFQSYALFPHMTVYDNVAFGLRMKSCPESEIEQRVNQVLKMVKLEAMAKRKPLSIVRRTATAHRNCTCRCE